MLIVVPLIEIPVPALITVIFADPSKFTPLIVRGVASLVAVVALVALFAVVAVVALVALVAVSAKTDL